jgi:hypothetical protein
MSYDNLSSVSQNVLICLQTDGHGETSIPPYNFVVGGINIMQKLQLSLKTFRIKTNSIHDYWQLLATALIQNLSCVS